MAIKREASNKTLVIIIIIISALFVGLLATGLMLLNSKDTKNVKSNIITDSSSIKKDETYKAVFLLNNQVYFGKIEKETENKLTLNSVYYLQVNQADTTKDKNAEPQTSLIKLGEEIHGPENKLEIMNQNILFIETLRKDSKVLEAIGNYEKQGLVTPQK